MPSKMNTGVYIISTPSGNQYVGSALNFNSRWSKHRKDLQKEAHHNFPLQSAYNKYGEAGLRFIKLLICKPENLIMFEQLAIDALKPAYNICQVAGSRLGAKLNPIAFAKIAEANKGRNLGRKHTPEARARMSAAHLGKIPSSETIAKRSASMLGKNKGKRRTLEDKEKRSAATSRPVKCIENGKAFKSVKAACQWVVLDGLSKSEGSAKILINKSIRLGKLAFGLTWTKVEKELVETEEIELID